MRDDRQGDRPPKRMSDQPGQTDPDVAVEELGPGRPWGRVVMLATPSTCGPYRLVGESSMAKTNGVPAPSPGSRLRRMRSKALAIAGVLRPTLPSR